MKVLDKFDFPTFGSGSREQRDWELLLDGKIRELTKGTDYECKSQTLAMQARAAAKKRGLKVRASAKKDGDTVILQAYKPSANGPTAESVTPKGKGKK